MRRYLSAYLHYIINIVTEGSVGYKIYYDIPDNTPDEFVETLFPIRIHIEDEGHVLTAWGLFESESERLKHSVSNLLSRDVAVVNTTTQVQSTSVDIFRLHLNRRIDIALLQNMIMAQYICATWTAVFLSGTLRVS
jgi:hypothetical protein